MKIILIGGRSIGSMDGITSYMLNLGSHLVKRGHEIIFYCESNEDKIEEKNGITIINQKSIKNHFFNKMLLSLKATWKIVIKNKNVDIIHYNAVASGVGSFLPLIMGKNVILQNHGQEWLRTKFTKKQRILVKALYDFVIFFQKNVTCVSKQHTEYVIERNKKKCIAIPCAASEPLTDIDSDILNKFSLSENGYFLFMGRFGEEKNIDILIDAYIKSGISSKKLVLAGGNNQNIDYEKELRCKGSVNENIIFTGPVGGLDKEKLISSCFVYCMQSTSEGMPIALLEGMSYAKVCISSDIASCKEALGENGVYVNVRDVDDLEGKLRYVSEHYEDIKFLGHENRKRIDLYYNWVRITDMYEQFCLNIIRK